MGTHLNNGYGLWKPTLTLAGSTKIFQTAIMFKNDSALNAVTCNSNVLGYFVGAGAPFNAAQMFVGYTVVSSECYVMQGGVLTYDLTTPAIVGSKAGSLGTPINTSIIVKKTTGIVGKRFRGRVMLPNITVPEANISQAGIIDSAGMTVVQNQWIAVRTPWLAGPIPPVLGHSTSEVLPTPIADFVVNPKLGTMAHRIRGF